MKARFLTQDLVVTEIKEGQWRLMKELGYESEVANQTITVPYGFVTDFASVPRVPVAYMLFGDRAHREAVVHDFLYQTHLVEKSIADKVFLEAMKVRGKPFWIRWSMYMGVVWGGNSAYKTGKERFKVLTNGNLPSEK